MAITPSQWSHVLTIPESYTPSAATSGQTLVITESVIAKLSAGDQTTFWSNVANGGGDVRICTDSGGVNQLPVEIVSLDNVAQTCVIWTRKPTYDGTGDLYVFIGKAGETQPAVTDPFGRNAVWVDSTHIQGGDGVTDVTGNTTISLSGMAAQTGSIKGFNSIQVPFVADNSKAEFLNTDLEDYTGDLTLSAWVNVDSSRGFATVLAVRSSSWEFHYRLESLQPAILIGNSSPNSTGGVSLGVDTLIHCTVSGSVISFYENGIPSGIANLSGTRNNIQQNVTFGAPNNDDAFSKLDGRIAQARTINGAVLSSSYIATEYANQSDPTTFYGTPTIATTGGGGAVEQPVVSVNAEEIHQANTLSISAFNSVSSVIAEQIESANLIDVFLSQLASSIQAQERHDATALNIEQSASQSVNSLTAEQIEQANLVDISQSLPVNSVQAQENQQANTLTIEQSAGQSISLNTAQQVEQATVLSLAQQQALAHIVAEQLSNASVTDVTNLQAVTMIIAEESHQANSLNVEQYTGQFVTLITAEQKSEAQTLLISEVSAIDVLQAEQVTNAETMAFSQVQRLTQITAEQLTEAQLLTIITSGDNTDLSGLRLIPVTSKYTINPTNTTRYSLQKV